MSFPRKYVTLLIFIIVQVKIFKEVDATSTTNGFECREETFDDNCNSLDLDRTEFYYLYYNGNFVNGMKYPLASRPQEYIQCFGQPHRREFVRVCQCTNGIFDPILQKCRPTEENENGDSSPEYDSSSTSVESTRLDDQQLDRQSREHITTNTTIRAPSFIDPFDESN